ncbi:gastrula zinc finger protein XlCGF17.1-like [Topomyia yanbarensis]|uniref:gastrula zinc finger protein XlCGF17.1-like n=1 Tax=Topomyia yanbarensis TaxID=2498891 RepID=UPI00273C62BD|nr:gastrula zinc finger protein XlCGF17.1-like [Topomyia yanbarensis]
MVCRTCLSTTEATYRSLYKESFICGKKRKFSDLLMEFIPNLQIIESDNLPKTICNRCCLTIKHLIRFRNQCLQSDDRLRTKPWINTNMTAGVELVTGNNTGINDELINITLESMTPESTTILDDIFLNEIFESTKPESVNLQTRTNPTRNLECQYCHKVLSSRKSLRCHMQLHSEEASFLCTCCGERFKTKMAYTGHMATHDPDKFRCDDCGKTYRQAASLRSHKLSHSQKKPFSCSICGHSTTQRSGLKKHMLTHSDIKSYVCDLCGEHFRFSCNLIMHKRRKHLRQKDFMCSSCPKEFISKDELLSHAICHSNDRPFKCEICEKTFSRKSSLQFHQKHKHYVLAKISCHICGKGFSQKVSLQSHLRTHILTE